MFPPEYTSDVTEVTHTRRHLRLHSTMANTRQSTTAQSVARGPRPFRLHPCVQIHCHQSRTYGTLRAQATHHTLTVQSARHQRMHERLHFSFT